MSTVTVAPTTSVTPYIDLANHAATIGATSMAEFAGSISPAIVFDVHGAVTLTSFKAAIYIATTRTIKWSIWNLDTSTRVANGTFAHTGSASIQVYTVSPAQALTAGARHAVAVWENSGTRYCALQASTTSKRWPSIVSSSGSPGWLAYRCWAIGSWYGDADIAPTAGNNISTAGAAITIYTS